MDYAIIWNDFLTILAIIGGISSTYQFIVPYKFKEKPRYYYNKYARYIFSKDVTTELIVKSVNIENIEVDKFKINLKNNLKSTYDDFRETDSGFSFNIKNGLKKIETKIDIITNYDEDVSNNEYVEQLECTFTIKCKTSNLKSNIINYMAILMHLKDNLNSMNVHLNKKFVLMCELDSLDKINKILDLGKLNSISGSNDNIDIELYKNKILIHDENFNNEFVKIVDDMMINYA